MKSLILFLFLTVPAHAQVLTYNSSVNGREIVPSTLTATTCLRTPASGVTFVAGCDGEGVTMKTSTLTVGGNAFSVGTSTLVVKNGIVGIGTTSPATKLHMSSGTLTVDGTGAAIKLQGPDTSLSLQSSGGGSGQTLNIGGANQNETNQINLLSSNSQINWQIRLPIGANGQLGFIPSTAGGGTTFTTPVMVLASGGNVGIGTTSPTLRRLHIYEAGTNAGLHLQHAGSTAADWLISTDASNPTGGGLVFYDVTASLYRIVISSSGNVGIGTTSPGYKLMVESGSVAITSGTLSMSGTGSPTTGGAICLNASNQLTKCTSAVDASGNCTCP